MAVVLLGTPVTTFAEEVVGTVTLSSGGKSVTGVTAPEGKEKKDITKVEIPASVTYVEFGAFNSCTSLTSLTVDPANTVYKSEDNLLLSKDGTQLVVCPGGLTSVVIPASVTSIRLPSHSVGDADAFSGCRSLTALTVDSANTVYKAENNMLLTKDGSELLRCAPGLTSAVVPFSVASVASGAFRDCFALASLSLPASFSSSGRDALLYLPSLVGLTVDAANTVYKSENNLLLSKDGKTLIACPGGLTSVEIPASVTAIGEGAFLSCTSLASVSIPASVTAIGEVAFLGCTSLASVSIPASVTSIGEGAFVTYSHLTSVTIPCDFDLKLFGWAAADGFTGESGVQPTAFGSSSYNYHDPAAVGGISFISGGTFTLSHAWDDGTITAQPTCTGTGVKTFTCTREDCGETKTEGVAVLGHDLSDVVVSEPTAETLGVVHRKCSREGCDYDIFSRYTLGDGTSPTMYPDGTRISDASYTPKATNTFDLNGQELTILLQDPLGVLGSGELGLTVRQTDLPATFDGDVPIEHQHSYDIIPTVNGVEKSGQLSNKVRLLYKIPQGWDRHDLEVFLAQAGEDGEFDEVTEKIGDDEYLVVWTDHFSPYVFVDKLNPEEKAELEKLQNSDDSDTNANTPKDESGNGQTNGNHSVKTGDAGGEILLLSTLSMIATGLYLALYLKKKKSF